MSSLQWVLTLIIGLEQMTDGLNLISEWGRCLVEETPSITHESCKVPSTDGKEQVWKPEEPEVCKFSSLVTSQGNAESP